MSPALLDSDPFASIERDVAAGDGDDPVKPKTPASDPLAVLERELGVPTATHAASASDDPLGDMERELGVRQTARAATASTEPSEAEVDEPPINGYDVARALAQVHTENGALRPPSMVAPRDATTTPATAVANPSAHQLTGAAKVASDVFSTGAGFLEHPEASAMLLALGTPGISELLATPAAWTSGKKIGEVVSQHLDPSAYQSWLSQGGKAVADKDAITAAAQLAVMTLPVSGAARKLLQTIRAPEAVGSAVTGVLEHALPGAAMGAAFDPNHLTAGAIFGGALGGALGAASGARTPGAASGPDVGANLAAHPDRLLSDKIPVTPTATARVAAAPVAERADESPFSVEMNSPKDALDALAREVAQTPAPNAAKPTPQPQASDVQPSSVIASSPSSPAAPSTVGPLATVRSAIETARAAQSTLAQSRADGERRALDRAANTDALTGFGNQRAWTSALPTAEADPHTSIIRFDLNGFKNVNDVHGHSAGDAALQSVAQAIRTSAQGLPAFRVGGDEFAVLAPKENATAVRDAIESAVGVQQVQPAASSQAGAPVVKYSISGGIGDTNAEADAAAIARKPAQKAAQGIGLRNAATPIAPTTAAPETSVRRVPRSEMDVEPERFQYKLNTNEKGVGRELENVSAWNPDLAGVIGVWRDPADGRLKVINGHHRVDLGDRNGVTEHDVREIQAPNAETARATGAVINIAEGRGTAIDAAKLFRDTQTTPEDLEARGVSLRGQVTKEGLALAKLAPTLFSDVVAGKMPVQRAVVIGASNLAPEQQLALGRMLEQREANGKRMTNEGIGELIRFVQGAGSETTTQDSLFGTEYFTQSLAPEKAELSAYVKDRLGKDRRLFGFLTKGDRAGRIETTGAGHIETERADALASRAAQAEEVYNKLSMMSGPVSDALTAAAREWTHGGDRNAIRTRLYDAISNAIQRESGVGGGAANAERGAEGSGRGGSASTSLGHEPTGSAGGVAAGADRALEADSEPAYVDPAQEGFALGEQRAHYDSRDPAQLDAFTVVTDGRSSGTVGRQPPEATLAQTFEQHQVAARLVQRIRALDLPVDTDRRAEVEAASHSILIDPVGLRMATPEDAATIMAAFRHPAMEILHFFVKKDGRILGHLMSTSGELTWAALPEHIYDDIAALAERTGADTVTPGHNHPSGDPTASSDDYGMQHGFESEIERRGLKTDGHIIIDHDKATWFTVDRATHTAKAASIALRRSAALWRTADDMGFVTVRSPSDAAGYLKAVTHPDAVTLGLVDAQHRLIAVSPRVVGALDTIATWLPATMADHAAHGVVIMVPEHAGRAFVERVAAAQHRMNPNLTSFDPAARWSAPILDVLGVAHDATGAPIAVRSYSESGDLYGGSLFVDRNAGAHTIALQPGARASDQVSAAHAERAASGGRGHGAPGEARGIRSRDRIDRRDGVSEHDLFGNEDETSKSESTQGSLFGSQAGSASSRSLAAAERAARSELDGLLAQERLASSPLDKIKLARRIAELQKFLNRDQKIGANELQYRARSGIDRVGEAPKDASDAAQRAIAGVIAAHPKVELNIYISKLHPNTWQLAHIRVPASERETGLGTAVMRDLTRAADAFGARITLTPGLEGNPRRLKAWYRDFGFKKNRSDFAVSDSMIREPGARMVREAPPVYGRNAEMFGAPGERPETEVTGVNNAASEAERERLGLNARSAPEPRTQDEMYAAGKAAADADPAALPRLLDELRTNPERIVGTKTEAGLLLKYRVDLDRQLRGTLQHADDARATGDVDAERVARLELAYQRERIREFVELAERTGTATARALAARKMMSSLDYDLVQMETTAEAAKGAPLTTAEFERIRALHAELQGKLAAADADRTAAYERAANAEADLHHAELRAEAAKPLLERVAARMESSAAAARARIHARGLRAMAGMDPVELADHAIIGAFEIAKGAHRFADWSARMTSELGDAIRPHLREIFDAANAKLNDELRAAKTANVAPRRHQTQPNTPSSARDARDLHAALRARIADGAGPDALQPYLRALALEHIRSGLTAREPLLTALYDEVRAAGLDASRSEVRDALSGYGQFHPLDRRADQTRLREIRAESQKLAQLEALERGQAPLATGFERQAPNAETRTLTKQVNAAKKAAGVGGQDEAGRLKSALSAAKTRARNLIADLRTEIDTGHRIVAGARRIISDAELDTLRAQLAELRKQEREIFGRPGLSDEQRLTLATRAAARNAAAWEDRLAKARAGTFVTKQQPARPTGPEVQVLRARAKAAKAEYESFKALDPAQQALKAHADNRAYRARLAAREADLLDRMARADYTPRPLRPGLTLDRESMQRRADVEAVKQKYQATLQAFEKANRTPVEKWRDRWSAWTRAGMLSYPTVLGKLTSVAAYRVVTTPATDLVALGVSKALPGIAAKSPRYGASARVALQAEARAHAAMWTAGMKAASDLLANRRPTIDLVHGKEKVAPALIEYLGQLHGALKAPIKQAEYARSLVRRTDTALRQGENVADPIVQLRLSNDAFLDANRAISMQDSPFVNRYNRFLRSLEEKDKATGKANPVLQLLATAMQTQTPIVKVPVNIVTETSAAIGGALVGPARAAWVYAHGLEDLKPVEADAIIRLIAAGFIGLAMMTLGFFKADKFGGYYQPGEHRAPGDVKAGGIRVGAHDVPAYLAENPFLWVAQFGATARRVMDSRFASTTAADLRAAKIKASAQEVAAYAKSTAPSSPFNDPSGFGAGVLAGAVGLTRDLPFSEEVIDLAKMLDPKQTGDVLEQEAAERVTPGVVQWVAKQTDPTIARPSGMTQQLEYGIPGLRRRIAESPAAADALRTRFQRMPADAAFDAFNRAPPSEQALLLDLLNQKIARAGAAP